jgi:hypothetical protein
LIGGLIIRTNQGVLMTCLEESLKQIQEESYYYDMHRTSTIKDELSGIESYSIHHRESWTSC